MEMDQESLNLCKRLEVSSEEIRLDVASVSKKVELLLNLLRGNELNPESGMINQMRELKLDFELAKKAELENKKIMFEKFSSDKTEIANRIEMVKMDFEKRLVPLEKWKDKVVYM